MPTEAIEAIYPRTEVHAEEADLSPEMCGVSRHLQKRFFAGPQQQTIDSTRCQDLLLKATLRCAGGLILGTSPV